MPKPNRVLIGLGALCLGACATSPPKSAVTQPAAAPLSAGCVNDTATRLPVGPDGCAGFGRTYTHQEISTTGATDAAQALRQLSPSLTITGQ